MTFKIDENLSAEAAEILRGAGFSADTGLREHPSVSTEGAGRDHRPANEAAR